MAILAKRITDGLGDKFKGIEKALTEKFLTASFCESNIDEAHRKPASLPVKAVGLAIPDPAATASQPKLDGINGHMWAYRVCSAPRNGRLPLFGPRRDHVGRETKGPLAQTSEVKRITIDCNDETAQRPATHHPSRKRNGSMILNPTINSQWAGTIGAGVLRCTPHALWKEPYGSFHPLL
jgi:hypothetical protein